MGLADRFLMTVLGSAVAVAVAAPAHADDAGFLSYLNTHGYTATYAGGEPITPASATALGHMICENLHVGIGVPVQAPNYPAWPQFGLIAEAAQSQLCPPGPN